MNKRRSANAKTERLGVNHVEEIVLDIGHIWREQTIEDVGIDGIIEVCIDNFPTGKLIGVQIKSGDSYFTHKCENGYVYYPDSKDLEYWKKHTLPIFLFFYNPTTHDCYWKDITNAMYSDAENHKVHNKIIIPNIPLSNSHFDEYAKSLFDLTAPSDDTFELITQELRKIQLNLPENNVQITGLDLFLNGLWGLCTKLLFHLSLITDSVKQSLIQKKQSVAIRMRLDRATLQPFIISYLKLLKEKRLADFDTNDANHTIYVKYEWPTFIAPLTLAGRKYIEFLRQKITDQRISDRQFFNLQYYPHVFIEVFADFNATEQTLGKATRSIVIQFNRYINDYVIQDIQWLEAGPHTVNYQHISFEELRFYIQSTLRNTDKNHILIRHQDDLISPLTCWLEEFIDNSNPLPFDEIEHRAPGLDRDLAMELFTVMSFGTEIFDTAVPEFIDVGKLWIKYHEEKDLFETFMNKR